MKRKIIAHLFQLPRWFAIPFFGASVLIGSSLAGGITANAWIAFVACLLVMAGGHSFNSFLDYAWTGLDKGEVENRSAEKAYTGGQNLIETKVVSLREVLGNAVSWYILSAIPIVYLAVNSTWLIFIPWVAGMLMTFWYSKSKFNYTHELALGVAVGPAPLLIGMLAVNAHPNFINGLLVSVPFAIVLSFAGLAIDEWEDAEANLKKGVKSLAYEVWKYSDYTSGEKPVILDKYDRDSYEIKSLSTLNWYLTGWFLFMFFYQGFLIQQNILKPLTGLAFLTFPFLMACMLKMKSDFKKWAAIIVIVGALYVILLTVGQIFGG
jgi:1,4-dihydroxy-2-naphthoate octaprenyltransferase